MSHGREGVRDSGDRAILSEAVSKKGHLDRTRKQHGVDCVTVLPNRGSATVHRNEGSKNGQTLKKPS